MTTDGFLYPNEVLRAEGLMERKGFPESYDVGSVLRFLSAIKAGQEKVEAPLYSHLTYDVLTDRKLVIDRPDILIFDEPTASLDGVTGRNILEFVKNNILNDSRCILIVTHDSRIFEFADRIIGMEDGKIVKIMNGGEIEG